MLDSMVSRYDKLATDLATYLKGQVKFWQQVPHWALEADGTIGGWSKIYNWAYAQGLWLPDQSTPQSKIQSSVAIDCATGTIVRLYRGKIREITSPDFIVPLLHKSMRPYLDAKQVVKSLQHLAEVYQPRHESAVPQREKYRQTYNVKPIFTRA